MQRDTEYYIAVQQLLVVRNEVSPGSRERLSEDRILGCLLRRRQPGVEVMIDVYPEMQHVLHFLAGTAPEADEAIGQLAA